MTHFTHTLWTIGHSNHPADTFLDLLARSDVAILADIRTLPRSRFNPQYNDKALASSLKAAGIEYIHLKDLGGLRKARANSINTGFRDGGFRGYSDYMQTKPFQQALDALITLSKKQRTVIMCAEAKPGECHRLLVSDALTVRGVSVVHILRDGMECMHTLHPLAQVIGNEISYPAKMQDLFKV
jgi:uncharacterized protein (DUF488 family)